MPSNASLVTVESTLTNNERPSIELKFSRGGTKIVNSYVADSFGRPLYSISSDSKHTKLLLHKDNTEVATIEWDRQSPRMVFRGKKFKCKEWLRPVGPRTKSRILVHGDSRFRWIQQPSQGVLIPANRSGLAVAKWRTESHSGDELHLQIFQEALVEPGLLEAIVLSIILLQSGRSLDSNALESMFSTGPMYYGGFSANYWALPDAKKT